MFDFDAFQAMADEMIGTNGETMELVDTSGNVTREIVAVEVDYLPREIDGDLILANDRRYYVQGPISPPINEFEERLRVGEDSSGPDDWRIVTVNRAKHKGGAAIFYELQVRSR